MDLTDLLGRAQRGDKAAIDQLYAELYRDLRDVAHQRVRQMDFHGAVGTTALVNESYMRLVNAKRLSVTDRAHFLNYASHTMRSIIVDMARARQSERYSGGALHVTLNTQVGENVAADESQVIAIHDALDDLARVDERLARVVEMRYFAGLTEAEIAESLGVTERTVRRDWEKARMLLAVALS